MKNITDFHIRLKELLWRNETLDLLPGCGWNDGGCRSLMKAFQLWFDSKIVETYQIVKTEEEYHSEHAFIKIGAWFIDGDGVSSYETLKHRWLTEELLGTVIIRSFDPNNEPNHIGSNKKESEPFYIEEKNIFKIVQMLNQHFSKDEVLESLTKHSIKKELAS